MQTITPHQFDQFVQRRRISERTASALRRVLVAGERPAQVANETNVPRSNLYRLANAAILGRPGDCLVTVSCPENRAEELKALCHKQVAFWRQQDGAQR